MKISQESGVWSLESVRSLFLFVLLSFSCFADYSEGVCGATFLKINSLPRPVSLGGAFSAVSDDLSALYYNPAGLSQLKVPEGVASAASWIDKTKFGIIGYCSPISENSGFGLSVLYLKTDKIPLYKDVDTSQSGEFFDAMDLSIRIGYGMRLTRSNYFGIVGGWINQRIEEEKSHSFFFDIGELYKPKSLDKMAFSIVLQNLGGKTKFIEEEDEMPLTLKVGFAYFPIEKIIFSLDFVKPKDNNYQIRYGFEWGANKNLTLRTGFNSQVFKDLGVGITGGFGIRINTFNLNYSYVPYSFLGETHNLSLTTHFGRN